MDDKVIEIYDAGFQDGRKERDYDPQSHNVVYDMQQRIEALTLALTEAAEWIRTRDDFKVSASEALKPIEALLKGSV